ncbi:hypothetical protein ATH90_2939 [Pseudomonas lurida]|uniref:hypothetical protein n=1 Tax=Pseudomonas lurida TaxID=244566 RepID=UPI000C002139|nr:hypothetical protein [Pseudomonas lurida]PFG24149.1 hypothetical protein ATH90_2939 [Pseudomonas lurida]
MKRFLAAIACLMPLLALADSQCNATNEVGAVCSISCDTGEAAYCKDGLGASSPTCECEANDNELKRARSSIKTLPNKWLASKSEKALTEQLEIIDVASLVSAKLAAMPNVQIGESCSDVEVSRECHEVGVGCYVVPPKLPMPKRGSTCNTVCTATNERRCTPMVGKFSVASPFYSPKPIVATIVEPNWQSIPNAVMGLKEEYINCGSLQQEITFRHQEVTRVGYKISKSRAVKKSNSMGVSMSAKMDFSFADVTTGVTYSMSRDVTVSEGNEETEETTRTLDQSFPLKVAPMKRVVFDHFWIKRIAPIRYTGTVTVEATLAANDAGKRLLSEVLPAEADRTFPFEGEVAMSSLNNGQSRYLEYPLTPEMCNGKPAFETLSSPY